MKSQPHHDMLPPPSHDEEALQQYVMSMRDFIVNDVAPGRREIWDAEVGPAFEKRVGRPAESHDEIWPEMESNPYWQMWSAMMVAMRETEFDVVGQRIERQLPVYIDRAKRIAQSNERLGSLTLDPAIEVPRYVSAMDIHRMPGNFHTELASDDVFAGAMYDASVFVYSQGNYGEYNDAVGDFVSAFIAEHYPDVKPKRILDIGCGIANSALAYAKAFPDAELYGIDVAAPSLRYGHARAETLGVPIHLSQQNAECTNFPDGHFDLILSHVVLHETSHKALPRIFRECYRLLSEGGLTLHADTPLNYKYIKDPFDRFLNDWNSYYLNEPFWGGIQRLDLSAMMETVGFDHAIEHQLPGKMLLIGGRK